MKSVTIYDKAMCCSTGVCGPQVDPVLPRFASDLDWLRSQGVVVERFNLSQQPQAFVQSPLIQGLLTAKGVDCLPVAVVDGIVMSEREYPSRELLSRWTGVSEPPAPLFVMADEGCCSKETGCCE